MIDDADDPSIEEVSLDPVEPPARGATDSVGMGEYLQQAQANVEDAAEGNSTDLPLDEARQHISDAQSALTALGFVLQTEGEGTTAVDSVFTPQMRDAVLQFQEENGLEATGTLDPETYEVLMAAYEQAVETHRDGPVEDDFNPMPGVHPLE